MREEWTVAQGVIERYTRRGFSGCIKHRSDLSGGTMFLAHSMHGEVEDLIWFCRSLERTSSECCISKYSSITPENSLNWFLDRRERSSVRNLQTAWVLDSPMAFAWGFHRSGTMNLPVPERWWFSSNCFYYHHSLFRRKIWVVLWFLFNLPEPMKKLIARSDRDMVWSDTAVWEVGSVGFTCKNQAMPL